MLCTRRLVSPAHSPTLASSPTTSPTLSLTLPFLLEGFVTLDGAQQYGAAMHCALHTAAQRAVPEAPQDQGLASA